MYTYSVASVSSSKSHCLLMRMGISMCCILLFMRRSVSCLIFSASVSDVVCLNVCGDSIMVCLLVLFNIFMVCSSMFMLSVPMSSLACVWSFALALLYM